MLNGLWITGCFPALLVWHVKSRPRSWRLREEKACTFRLYFLHDGWSLTSLPVQGASCACASQEASACVG